jgi:hypothetical protein
MNFSATFVRRLHWLNLPGAFLIALLQRTPVLRVASTAGEITRASPVGAVLRAAVATAASLGALHSLSILRPPPRHHARRSSSYEGDSSQELVPEQHGSY